jgi:hypothetical protein
MSKKLFYGAAAAAATLSMPATGAMPNVGVDSGQFTIGISGYVPVVCRASVEQTMVSPHEGEVSLGALREFCNSPNGYAIHADYSDSLAKAAIIVDGRKVHLGKSGTTEISKSNRAGIATRALELDLPKGVQGGSVSFRIVPL